MTVTPYARAQGHGQSALRTTLLDIAGELLATEGPEGLSMRRIASAAGCSTTVLYTLFGGKDGLVDALYVEGFSRFSRRFEAVREEDPLYRLYALGHAYRATALAARNYYALMFGRPIPGWEPSPQAMDVAQEAFGHLERAVTACLEEGRIPSGDPKVIAESLWSVAHGVVSLELAGHLSDPDAVFTAAVTAIGVGFAPTEEEQ
jgi:AcrR family transcriptional regulator